MALIYQTSWDSISGLYDPQSELTDAIVSLISDPSDSSCLNLNSLFNPDPNSQFNPKPNSQLKLKPGNQFNPELNYRLIQEPDSQFNMDLYSQLNPKPNYRLIPEPNSLFNQEPDSQLNKELNFLSSSQFNPEQNSQLNKELNSLFNQELNFLSNTEQNSQFNLATNSQLNWELNSQLNQELNSQFNCEPNPQLYLYSRKPAPLSISPPVPSLYQYRYSANDDFTPNPSKKYKICNDLFNTKTSFNTPTPSSKFVYQNHNSFGTVPASATPGPKFGYQHPNSFSTVPASATPGPKFGYQNPNSFDTVPVSATPSPTSSPKFGYQNPNLFDTVLVPASSSPSPSLSPSPRLSPYYSQEGFGYQNQTPNWVGTVPVPISAPSMAARVRRKKISDKIQAVAKLVPGGTRMHTAEMFEAASNYIKFLQAQIEILTIMNANQEVALEGEKLMRGVLGSKKLQEKLSEKGNCLVPRNLVKNLAMDQVVRSNVSLSEDLDCFLESI